MSNPFKSDAGADAPQAVSSDSLLADAKADAGNDTTGAVGSNNHCPQVVAWPQDKLVTIYQPGHVGEALSIVHRGEITKLSRECELSGDRMVVRYGFAGRVLLGPKGQGGSTVTLPVSIRVASAEHKVISTDAVRVATTIPQGSPVGYFSMVKEVSFPIAMGTRPEDYKIFVGLQRTQAGAG
jgi:hypothetical protein